MEVRFGQSAKDSWPTDWMNRGRVTASSAEQPLKAYSPIDVTVEGMHIPVSDEQLKNTQLLIDINPWGRLTSSSAEQPLKAPPPIEVTVEGMDIPVCAEQRENAPSPIDVNPWG